VTSIRRRLLLVLSIGFAALIGIMGFYVEGLLRERVTEDFDVALLAEARGLAALTDRDEKGRIAFDYAPEHMPQFEREDRPEYFQFWLDDGTPLPTARSGSLAKDSDLPRMAAAAGEPAFRDVALPDGRAGRAVQFAFGPKSDEDEGERVSSGAASSGPGLLLVVAKSRDRLDRLLARLRVAIAAGGGAATLFAALLAWRALASGLRPIDAIASQVRSLDADTLGARIVVSETPRELTPIVHQLNALLARLEASFERERRFAGHVAHELRTPIAELRSLAEVGGRWPEDTASTMRFFGDVQEIAGRMERVVVDLLLLARCHAGVEPAQRSPVRLREVVESTWSDLAAKRATRDLHVDVPADLVVASDPGKLSLILGNLLDNAISYSPPDGPIRCVASAADRRFVLDIVNPADPLTEDDLRNLAQPFWRKDRARSAETHAGLGLSLVTALAKLLELDTDFRQDPEGMFRVRLGGWLWRGA